MNTKKALVGAILLSAAHYFAHMFGADVPTVTGLMFIGYLAFAYYLVK